MTEPADLYELREQARAEAERELARASNPRRREDNPFKVSVPLTSAEVLELLWAIAIAGDREATPLVLKLETALGLVSAAKPPRIEIAEAERPAIDPIEEGWPADEETNE